MITSAWYCLSAKEVKDSTFFKNKIGLFQNVMAGKDCFYTARKKGTEKREAGEGGGGVEEIPKRRTPS